MTKKIHLIFLIPLLSFLILPTLLQSEENIYRPLDPGKHILSTARQICFVDKEIIIGSCWDFVSAVYLRAGYSSKKRESIFKSVKAGPYANVDLIKPGDWLYISNQEHGGIEHSVIFVEWLNREEKLAKTIDYVGGKRTRVGKYTPHLLTHVYGIIRPKVVQSSGVK